MDNPPNDLRAIEAARHSAERRQALTQAPLSIARRLVPKRILELLDTDEDPGDRITDLLNTAVSRRAFGFGILFGAATAVVGCGDDKENPEGGNGEDPNEAPTGPKEGEEGKEKVSRHARFKAAIKTMKTKVAPKKDSHANRRCYIDIETLDRIIWAPEGGVPKGTSLDDYHDENRRQIRALAKDGTLPKTRRKPEHGFPVVAEKGRRMPKTKISTSRDWPIPQITAHKGDLAVKHKRALKPLPNGELPIEKATDSFYSGLELGSLHTYLQKAGGEKPNGEASSVTTKFLALCVYGQITTESGWDYGAVSDKAARGPFQILPSTAAEILEHFKGTDMEEELEDIVDFDNPNLHDLPESNIVAALYYERAFQKLKPLFDVVEGTCRFPSHRRFVEDFVIPCLVNSYHSGIGNIKRMINYYLENHQKSPFKEYIEGTIGQGPYGKDLYMVMSYMLHLYEKVNNKECQEAGNCYGTQSRLYYLKCYATAQLLGKLEQEREAGMPEDDQGPGNEPPEEHFSNFDPNILDGSYEFIEDNTIRNRVRFKNLDWKQADRDKLKDPMNWRKNTLDWLHRRGYQSHKVQDNSGIARMRRQYAGRFKDLQVKSSLAYRCSPSNMKDTERRFATTDTVEKFLPELTWRMNKYLWEEGVISRRYLVRPLLNSTFRTRAGQKRAGGSYESAHEMGTAIDIGVKAFDVVDLHQKDGDKKFRYTTMWNNKPKTKAHVGAHPVDKAMMHALAEMITQGDCFAIREYHNRPHFHVVHKSKMKERQR